jgi:hypothetical protein
VCITGSCSCSAVDKAVSATPEPLPGKTDYAFILCTLFAVSALFSLNRLAAGTALASAALSTVFTAHAVIPDMNVVAAPAHAPAALREGGPWFTRAQRVCPAGPAQGQVIFASCVPAPAAAGSLALMQAAGSGV